MSVYSVAISFSSKTSDPLHTLALVAAAMYDALAATDNAYEPLSDTCLPPISPDDRLDVIAYAAYATILSFLSDADSIKELHISMSNLGYSKARLRNHIAVSISNAILEKYALSPPQPPYIPHNPPSSTFDADCSLSHPDKWQAQCIQSSVGFPCSARAVPFTALHDAPLISSNGARNVNSIISDVPPPPMYNASLSDLPFSRGKNAFADQFLATLTASATLDDIHKTVAEVFASNTGGRSISLALDEAVVRNLTTSQTIVLLMAVSSAVRDAFVAAVTIKLRYDSVRPVTVLQCAYSGLHFRAWKGPYQGVQTLGPDDKWRPYLSRPTAPAYVSGSSAMSAAAARVLKRFFGDLKGANCFVRMAGMSSVEPRVEKGAFGYMDGVTDVPNEGAESIGYSPAADVTVCWRNWEEFANLVAMSRLFSGIHVPLDNEEGARVGTRIGDQAYNFVKSKCDSCRF